mmetsp:Transcript_19692/g.33759  ORF Transcript_19692/g.33759 Transcript_19692/m.33759 type:complete len:162 (+) Transcript_19692:170-655(+)
METAFKIASGLLYTWAGMTMGVSIDARSKFKSTLTKPQLLEVGKWQFGQFHKVEKVLALGCGVVLPLVTILSQAGSKAALARKWGRVSGPVLCTLAVGSLLAEHFVLGPVLFKRMDKFISNKNSSAPITFDDGLERNSHIWYVLAECVKIGALLGLASSLS